jgi:hypothetical protein
LLTIDDIRERLKDANLASVSRNSGVNYMALIRLMSGRYIGVKNLEKLSDYLIEGRKQ